jgi:TonB family protein
VKIKWKYLSAFLGAALIISCCVIAAGFLINAYKGLAARCRGDKAEDYDGGDGEITLICYGCPETFRTGEWHYHLAQAEILRDQERWEEALEAYDYVLTVEHPPSCMKHVYVGKARAFFALGRYEEAVDAYSLAIQPELTGSCEHLCDKATSRFDLKHDVTLGGPFDRLRAVWDEGTYVEVLAYLKAAHESEPGHGYPYYMEGRVWLALGHYEKAVSYFDVVIERWPDHAPAWERKAWTLALMGRYEAALACADRALALDAGLPESWNTRGKILLLTGEAGAAHACFNRALSLEPYLAEPLIGEGITYFVEGNNDKGRTYFDGLAAAYGPAYNLLYSYLADRAEGRPASDLLKPPLGDAPEPWPGAISPVLMDRVSAEDVMAEVAEQRDLADYPFVQWGPEFTVTGAAAGDTLRSKAVIANVVARNEKNLRTVYDKYLQNDSYLHGDVVARLTIGASGAVTACSVVSSTLGNAAMEREVCDRVATWRFPAVDAGDVAVVYPFGFYTSLTPRD